MAGGDKGAFVLAGGNRDTELLRRAVVAIEKKLRESVATATALQGELRAAREEAADLPEVRLRLADAVAARDAAQEAADRWRREAALSREAVEDAQRLQQRAAEATQATEAAVAESAAAAQRWRADAEAATLEGARAHGQAELLEHQVAQLETANSELRSDNQQNAAKLRQAYERWVGAVGVHSGSVDGEAC